jgi:heme O synthase-like polyprenyltransferase
LTTSPRVRTGRLSNAATALMIVLGIFTLAFVNAIAGAVLLAVGVAMYLFGVWLRRKRKEADAGGKGAIAPSVSP